MTEAERLFVQSIADLAALASGEAFVIPTKLDEIRKGILGLMCFQCAPVTQIYRKAGFDIAPRAEAEQAFVIHRALMLAAKNGDKWRAMMGDEMTEILAKAPPEPETGEGG